MATKLEDVLPPLNNGKSILLGNSRIIFRVAGDDTAGAYSVFEYRMAPGDGAPLHIHHNEEESFFILEGAITFQLGNDKTRATPGKFISIRRGLRHAFVNAEAEFARALIILTPSGLEYFFLELSELLKNYPSGIPADVLQALTEKYGLDFNPPAE